MAPPFEHYGVHLWAPEVGGRNDYHAEDHEQTMPTLELSSKREITRTRVRVRTAMATQTREQGRCPGGRPPYGYGSETPGRIRTRRTWRGAPARTAPTGRRSSVMDGIRFSRFEIAVPSRSGQWAG